MPPQRVVEADRGPLNAQRVTRPPRSAAHSDIAENEQRGLMQHLVVAQILGRTDPVGMKAQRCAASPWVDGTYLEWVHHAKPLEPRTAGRHLDRKGRGPDLSFGWSGHDNLSAQPEKGGNGQ